MMAFKTRQYDVFLFLAAPNAPALWHWQNWQQLEPLLSPLMQSPRGRTSIRMTQFELNSSRSPNDSYIRFGPLGWNSKAHQKWTHYSPLTTAQSANWQFQCASVWVPGPGICQKEDCPPDVYLTIKNELVSGLVKERCRYAYSLMLAFACDIPQQLKDEVLSACRSMTQAVLTVKNRTSWYPDFDSGSMTEWDMYGAPYKPGNHHRSDMPLSADILQGNWQHF